MSSEPPPTRCPRADRLAERGRTFGRGRVSAASISRWSALASVWSSSFHFGIPTRLMFAYIASAIALLKCCGQAVPSTRDVTVVSVIIAAPFGHRVADLPHLLDVRDSRVSRK